VSHGLSILIGLGGQNESKVHHGRGRKGKESATMQMKLRLMGATQNVTGSRYLLEVDGFRILIDCGLFQEREFAGRNWEPFSVPPETIEALLLTHAHIDHCGLLPKLVREGFRGRVYCTAATADVAEIMLLDAAKLQEEDAAFKRKRHEREGRKGPYPEVPLYNMDDANASLRLFLPVPYGEEVVIGHGVEAKFYDAGHILGSSMIMVSVRGQGEQRTILFSGDVGRRNAPILRDPTTFAGADYVLVEATYGDRLHEGSSEVAEHLAAVVNSTLNNGGNIIVPSFALERAQEVLYYLNKLLIDGRIPRVMVFVDSPMAVRVTQVFERHPDLYDQEMLKLMRTNRSPFDFPGLKMVHTIDESKAINQIKGSAMIIAGSGMCTGGRIKHHLAANISRPESTVMFVGYQAAGTLGRYIVEGASEVRILGQDYPVRARIEQIQGFSAHADRDGLFEWLSHLQSPPRQVFITHGEPDSCHSFAAFLKERTGWGISVPAYQDEVVLE
jgi:metallo-beta-lactamase family protein